MYICVCIYIYTYDHVRTYMYVYTRICIHVCIHVCIHTCTYMIDMFLHIISPKHAKDIPEKQFLIVVRVWIYLWVTYSNMTMVLMFRIKVAYNRPQLYSYPSLQDKLKYHPKKKLSDSRRKKQNNISIIFWFFTR